MNIFPRLSSDQIDVAMEAMNYEMIMRKAFATGRGGVDGEADADVFRRYELANRRLRGAQEAKAKGLSRTTLIPIDELEYEVRKNQARVCNNIDMAIDHVIATHPEKTEELESLRFDTTRQNYPWETVCERMRKLLDALNDLGLLPR